MKCPSPMTTSPSNLFSKRWDAFVPIGKPTLIFIPHKPVPASRPRVAGRHGAYYTGPYADYRKVMPDKLAVVLKRWATKTRPLYDNVCLRVRMLFLVNPPSSTSLEAPDPDIDNFEKAIYDICTEQVWDDDSRIVQHQVLKDWTKPGEEEGVVIEVTTNGTPFKKASKRKASKRSTVSRVSRRRA